MRTLLSLLLPLVLVAACSISSTSPSDAHGAQDLPSASDAPLDLATLDRGEPADALPETTVGPDVVIPDGLSDTLADLSDGNDLPDTTLDVTDALPDGLADPADASPDSGADVFDEISDQFETELADLPPPPEFAELWPIGDVEKECEGGLLASLQSPSGPIRILVLRGSHYQMGRQAGCLIGADTGQFMANFLSYYTEAIQEAAADMGLAPEQTSTLLISMLNNIWLHMLPYVDQRFLDEFEGFAEVALATPEIAAHWTETQPDWALHAFVLLSNLSDLNWGGTIEDLLEKLDVGASQQLLDFYADDEMALLMRNATRAAMRRLGEFPLRTTCSYFAAWGPRTSDGHLLGSRNLDWSTDTGIAQMKGITFFAPEGGTPHASIGYLGFFGALAGISRNGIILSEVGSQSVMERLTGQPWTLKFREVLEDADDLDAAVSLLAGISQDGKLRPPTIGYNWMAGWGDPAGSGQNAPAAAVENNGVVAGILGGTAQCTQETQVVHYAQDGTVLDIVTNDDDPVAANLEAQAQEVDADGVPRHFATHENGDVMLDANGCPSTIVSDGSGAPFTVGRPLGCALFRGDEALSHAVRRWQTASHGPQGGGGNKLLCTSSSYRNRYLVMHDMLHAYDQGTAYEHNGVSLIEPTGQQTPVSLYEAEQIARAAAMNSNVMSIAYDATALTVRFSFEIGTGDTWQAAHKHGYMELPLADAFTLLATTPPGGGDQ